MKYYSYGFGDAERRSSQEELIISIESVACPIMTSYATLQNSNDYARDKYSFRVFFLPTTTNFIARKVVYLNELTPFYY